MLYVKKMDKFVIKKALTKSKRNLIDESAGGSDTGSSTEYGKKPRDEKGGSLLEHTYTWKRICAENLSCDYTSLFTKADANEIFHQLEKDIVYFTGDLSKVQVYGKWHNVPRKQVTYGDDGLTYTFSGITLSPKPWIPVLNHIREKVQLATGHSFNFVLINRYNDGNDHIGEHRDDEKELVPRSPIASVSFGASRDFIFRHRDSRSKNNVRKIESVKLELEHGSLLMMNFPTNVYCSMDKATSVLNNILSDKLMDILILEKALKVYYKVCYFNAASANEGALTLHELLQTAPCPYVAPVAYKRHFLPCKDD